MAQVTSYVTPSSPLSMAQLKTALDNMFAAVVSSNRGTTAPENPVEGISWLDTSGDPVEVMKVYRTAGWRSILEYNNTTGAITLYRNINGTALASAFALTLLGDADASTALSTLGVSAYAKTLLDDANASAALTTLGVSAFAKTILDDTDAAAARLTLGLSGQIRQVVNTQRSDMISRSETIPVDNTIPQISEGYEILSASVTPEVSTEKIKIDVIVYGAVNSGNGALTIALFQGSTADAIAVGYNMNPAGNSLQAAKISYIMEAGGTSAITFSVRLGAGTATWTLNGSNGARLFGGKLYSKMTISVFRG